MGIVAIGVFTWKGPTTEPVFIAQTYELSQIGFFQRGTVREMLTFAMCTIAQRTHPDQRLSVAHGEEYICHAHHTSLENKVVVLITDHTYALRAAFGVIEKIMHGSVDVETALSTYQNPHDADDITRIQYDLDDTKRIIHKTLESVLERGEKLDTLVQRSRVLSLGSQQFYRHSKNMNSCCKMS